MHVEMERLFSFAILLPFVNHRGDQAAAIRDRVTITGFFGDGLSKDRRGSSPNALRRTCEQGALGSAARLPPVVQGQRCAGVTTRPRQGCRSVRL